MEIPLHLGPNENNKLHMNYNVTAWMINLRDSLGNR